MKFTDLLKVMSNDKVYRPSVDIAKVHEDYDTGSKRRLTLARVVPYGTNVKMLPKDVDNWFSETLPEAKASIEVDSVDYDNRTNCVLVKCVLFVDNNIVEVKC